MKKQEHTGRLIAAAVMYIAIAVVFVGRLLYLQVSGQDYYTMSRQTQTVVRYEKIQAQREATRAAMMEKKAKKSKKDKDAE